MTMVWSPDYLGSPGKMVLAKDYPADDDTRAYVAAVESADGQSLEPAVIAAYDNFIVGCKADGIWDAIKASCILAGARTLSGALVPLAGTAPTNFNFVAADYDRKTGLVGDGSTKYLDSNRASNADLQDDAHWTVFPTNYNTRAKFLVGNEYISNNDAFSGFYFDQSPQISVLRSRNGSATAPLVVTYLPNKLVGTSRNNSSSFDRRYNSISDSASAPSYPPSSVNWYLFRRVNASSPLYSDSRIAFYSIGEALDLALFDARVTDLINAIGVAIP